MHKLTALPGGLRLLTTPLPATHSATVLLLVDVGSRAEQGRMVGAAHFLEHMIFKGTQKRTARQVNVELDSLGAIYNAFTGKEYTGYWIKTAPENLSAALEILSDLTLHATLPAEEITKERTAIVEEINMHEDWAASHLITLLEELLYEGTALAHDIAGTRESVLNLQKKDLVGFRRTHYGVDNMVLSVAGNFNRPVVQKTIQRLFQNIPPTKPAAREKKLPVTNTVVPRIRVQFRRSAQTHLALGFTTFPFNHPKTDALKILSVILGGNASSRLYESVRERSGLAYEIHAFTESFKDTGYLGIQGGFGNDQATSALRLIIDELIRLKTDGITAEELENAQKYLRGKIALALEGSDDWANFLGLQALRRQKILTPAAKIDKINRVKKETVNALAQELFQTEALHLALIGPFRSPSPFAKILKP